MVRNDSNAEETWDELVYSTHYLVVALARADSIEKTSTEGPHVCYVNWAGTAKGRDARRRVSKEIGVTYSDKVQLSMELGAFYGVLQISRKQGVGLAVLDPILNWGASDPRPAEPIEVIYDLNLAGSEGGMLLILANGLQVAFTSNGSFCQGGRRGKMLYPRSVKDEKGRSVVVG